MRTCKYCREKHILASKEVGLDISAEKSGCCMFTYHAHIAGKVTT